MTFDLVIRGGTVVDGTGAPARPADVGIRGDRIVAIEPRLDAPALHDLDASGRIVTPGFVDVQPHLDVQLAWDPVGTGACWHGVTTVVSGSGGVTPAPSREADRARLVELVAGRGDLPAEAVREALALAGETHGHHLARLEDLAKGPNLATLVGHAALRLHAMGERTSGRGPALAEELARMSTCLDEALDAGAVGLSTSRSPGIPGAGADAEELLFFADVLGRHGGLVHVASPLGEGDEDEWATARAEVAWMAELSRRSGRPVAFALTASARRIELHRRLLDAVHEEIASGARLCPQVAARGAGRLFGIAARTPFDNAPSWQALHQLSGPERMLALRDTARRSRLIADADEHGSPLDLRRVVALVPGEPERSLVALADERGICPAAAFIELVHETEGRLVCAYPADDHHPDAVEALLDDPLVTLAGAAHGGPADPGQATFFLTYWVRERERWSVEQAVRRLSSDLASVFGLADRGTVQVGAHADLNVIDWERLALDHPRVVHDATGRGGRYVQSALGYDATVVNGQVFMEGGEHTGTLAGRLLRRR